MRNCLSLRHALVAARRTREPLSLAHLNFEYDRSVRTGQSRSIRLISFSRPLFACTVRPACCVCFDIERQRVLWQLSCRFYARRLDIFSRFLVRFQDKIIIFNCIIYTVICEIHFSRIAQGKNVTLCNEWQNFERSLSRHTFFKLRVFLSCNVLECMKWMFFCFIVAFVKIWFKNRVLK